MSRLKGKRKGMAGPPNPTITSSQDHKYVGRPGYRPLIHRVNLFGKASVTRLIKRNPSKGTSQPYADKIIGLDAANRVGGGPGTDQVPVGASKQAKARTAPPYAGTKAIRDRGVNRKIKKN
jgi:hypothetical protein